ncbi:hypothetical protein ACFX2F_044415 [Malus domestica]
MSNFATTKHHHHGSYGDHHSSGKWANSPLTSLRRVESSCYSSPHHKPASSQAGPSRYPSSAVPRRITSPSRTNNHLGPSRSHSSIDPMRFHRCTAPTHPTYGLTHFRSLTRSCGPLSDPNQSKSGLTVPVLDFWINN